MSQNLSPEEKDAVLKLQQDEVATLRRDFPKEMSLITVAYLGTPGGAATVREWCREASPEIRAMWGVAPGEAGAVAFADMIIERTEDGHIAHTLKDPYTGRGLARFGFTAEAGFAERLDDNMRAVVHHTMGRLIVPGASAQTPEELAALAAARRGSEGVSQLEIDVRTRRASITDVFTVASGFAYGFLNRREAENISVSRAEPALFGQDYACVTTPALDRVMTDMADDQLAALGPRDRLRLALHASRAAVDADVPRFLQQISNLTQLQHFPAPESTKEQRARFFASVCDQSDQGSLLHHMAARVLTASFEDPARFNFQTGDPTPLTGGIMDSARRMLTKKAEGSRFERYLAPGPAR